MTLTLSHHLIRALARPPEAVRRLAQVSRNIGHRTAWWTCCWLEYLECCEAYSHITIVCKKLYYVGQVCRVGRRTRHCPARSRRSLSGGSRACTGNGSGRRNEWLSQARPRLVSFVDGATRGRSNSGGRGRTSALLLSFHYYVCAK